MCLSGASAGRRLFIGLGCDVTAVGGATVNIKAPVSSGRKRLFDDVPAGSWTPDTGRTNYRLSTFQRPNIVLENKFIIKLGIKITDIMYKRVHLI